MSLKKNNVLFVEWQFEREISTNSAHSYEKKCKSKIKEKEGNIWLYQTTLRFICAHRDKHLKQVFEAIRIQIEITKIE